MRFGTTEGNLLAVHSEDFAGLLYEVTGKSRKLTDVMSAVVTYGRDHDNGHRLITPIPDKDCADARSWRTRQPTWISLEAIEDARFLPRALKPIRESIMARIRAAMPVTPEPEAPQAEPETHPVASQKKSRPDRPNVFDRDGALLTSSVDVAVWFDKDHPDVTNAIEGMRLKLGTTAGWFILGEYEDKKGRKQRCYFMTREGLTILVMGFTGQKATAFKEAYIQEFERMDAERKGRTLPPPVGQPSNEMTTIQQRMAMMDQQMAMMVRWMESGTQQISVLTTTTTALVALMTQLVEGQQQQVQQPSTVSQPQRPPESNVRQMHDMRHPGWVTLTRFTKDTQIDGNTVRAFGFAHGMLRRTAENDITSDLRDNSSLIVYCPQEINGRVKPGWCITERGYHELPHLIRQWMRNKTDEQDHPGFNFSS